MRLRYSAVRAMRFFLFSALAAGVTVAGFATVVWIAQAGVSVKLPRRRLLALALVASYVALLILRPMAWPVIDLAVPGGAIGGVLWFERELQIAPVSPHLSRRPGVMDLISMASGGVSHGLVEHFENDRSMLLYLALVAPFRGATIPIVGISDLFIGGCAALALIRMKFPRGPVILTLAGALLSALIIGLWRGGAPALPFLALGVYFLIWWRCQHLARW